MINKNSESCVTSVTRPSLLHKMLEKRQGLPTAVKTCPKPAISTSSEPVNPRLPRLVIDWIAISLSEGHMQPSQPSVGRLEGWPIRSYFKNSLYVDFECWCLKTNIPTYLIPSKELFYLGTDAIFEIVAGDKYQFPDLMICREKFSKLIKEIKNDQS